MPSLCSRPLAIHLIRAAAVLFCCTPLIGVGSLKWEKQRIELTAKTSDLSATGIFHFMNDGSNPVTITSVETSCGCTTAELAKRTFAPGEAGEIRAVFKFGERVGHQEKFIHVTSDDAPANPTNLQLQVEILETFTFTPRLLLWRTTEGNPEKTTIVTNTGPAQITSL